MNQEILEKTILKLKPKLLSDTFGLEPCIKNLCAALIVEYMQEKNIFVLDVEIPIEKLITQLEVIPKYRKMIYFFLSVLESEGLVYINENCVGAKKNFFEHYESKFFMEKVRTMYPKFYYFLSFVADCSKKYHQVLSGQLPGTSLLFPSGDTEKLERLYMSTPKLGYEEALLHTLKSIILRSASAGGSYSVLEIGAGQGILTSVLYPLVGNVITNYCVTDISKSFVDSARKRFSKPEFDFLPLDCTKEITLDSRVKSFDVVIGFNVIHATPNISETLNNLSKHVVPGGKLMFVENVKQEIWIDMIYGLVDGWWNFDDEYRISSPLLNVVQWNDLLSKENYRSYEVLPRSSDSKEYESGCIIIEK